MGNTHGGLVHQHSCALSLPPRARCWSPEEWCGDYRGTSLIIKGPPTSGEHMTLGMVLPQVPSGALFLMSEVPL